MQRLPPSHILFGGGGYLSIMPHVPQVIIKRDRKFLWSALNEGRYRQLT